MAKSQHYKSGLHCTEKRAVLPAQQLQARHSQYAARTSHWHRDLWSRAEASATDSPQRRHDISVSGLILNEFKVDNNICNQCLK